MDPNRSATTESGVSAIDRERRFRATFVALLVAQSVLLVAIVWMARTGPLGPSAAVADDRVADAGVANVGPRQRKSMLESLAAIEKRLADIDARLADGVLRVEIADDDAHR